MTIVLFVEGETEKYLPEFLSRWLNPKLANSVAIKPVDLKGSGNYRKEFAGRARLAVQSPHVVGAVGLLDFSGSGIRYPDGTLQEKYVWAKQELEREVNDSRFRQHFAVHETEAWLLSEPGIFPRAVIPHLPKATNPETINTQDPPSHRLKTLYHQRLGKTYDKPLAGSILFRKLDPETAYRCCPHLKLLLDDILALGQTIRQ